MYIRYTRPWRKISAAPHLSSSMNGTNLQLPTAGEHLQFSQQILLHRFVHHLKPVCNSSNNFQILSMATICSSNVPIQHVRTCTHILSSILDAILKSPRTCWHGWHHLPHNHTTAANPMPTTTLVRPYYYKLSTNPTYRAACSGFTGPDCG